MVPKANNLFRKSRTPLSESCEAKKGRSTKNFTVQKVSSKLNTHQWQEVIRSFIPLCYLIFIVIIAFYAYNICHVGKEEFVAISITFYGYIFFSKNPVLQSVREYLFILLTTKFSGLPNRSLFFRQWSVTVIPLNTKMCWQGLREQEPKTTQGIGWPFW